MTVFPASLLPRQDSMLAVSSLDQGIKLFGKTIPCPAPSDNADQPEIPDEFHGDCEEDGFSPRGVYDELGVSCGIGNRSEDEDCPDFSMDEKERSEVPDCAEKLQESSKNLSLTMEAKVKALRRLNNPVACPRCESLDTKFCYFNNYNVNQPRHFCKHCQRYWTAGGTLRNVPVGAGKRKGKHPSSQQRPTFPLQSVVYRRDDSGAAESLLSYSIPQQRTNMKPSSQSASQITSCAGKDSEFSSGSVSSHKPLFVSVSANGSTTGTEWVVRKDPSTDFQSYARDSSVGHSSNTSLKAGATECPELSLCSISVPAPSIQKVPSSNSERSTFHQDQSSTPPESSSNTQILPVLAVPWPFMYQMYPTQIPSRAHTSTLPLYPSTGDTLSCHWSHVPGPVWTFPSTVAPASAHGLGIPTSVGKRVTKDSMEGSSLNGPKTPRIHEREAAASSSSLTTLDMVEKKSA